MLSPEFAFREKVDHTYMFPFPHEASRVCPREDTAHIIPMQTGNVQVCRDLPRRGTSPNRKEREEAVQGSAVTRVPFLCPACAERFVWARGFRRRFVPGKRRDRAPVEKDWLDGDGVIRNSSPEASACERFFPLSAHGSLRRTWCRTVGGWVRDTVRGLGTVPSLNRLFPVFSCPGKPPPVRLLLRREWDFPPEKEKRRFREEKEIRDIERQDVQATLAELPDRTGLLGIEATRPR
jgi:hypothetical protein